MGIKTALLGLCVVGAICAPTSTLDAQTRGISLCAPNTLAVTTVSANVALSSCGPDIYLMNTTSQEAFFLVGPNSGLTATASATASYSLPGGAYEHIVIPYPPSGTYYLAGITATSVTTIRILQGFQQ